MRTTKIFAIALLGLVLFAASAAWEEAATVPPAKPGDNTLSMTIALPQGDARAGRLVLLDLKCNSCHPVAGKRAEHIKWPVSATSAPLLDRRLADMDPGQLVTSIIAPSHVVSAAVAAESEGKLSPMGDFNHALTVRQLTDLVSYLRTLDQPWEEAKAVAEKR
jgi:hypothetical protein